MRSFVRYARGLISLCLLGAAPLVAAPSCNGWPQPKTCQYSSWPSPLNIDAGVGFRADKFKWSLPGFDNFPNTLSEVQWRDLRIIEYKGFAEYVSCTNYAIRLQGDYGHIYHGRYRDADYAGDDKTDIYSLSHGKAAKGYVYDYSAAAGYRVTSNCSRLVATPLIGYSQHAQYLHMYSATQDISLDPNALGPIPGLNSRYTTRWFGPWIGLDFTAQVERCAYLFGSFQWHMLTYRGHGRWNLREDIGPFYQKAYGYGYVGVLGGKWEIWDNWSFGVTGTYRMFRTKHGSEHVKIYPEDEPPFEGVGRFGGAIWHSFGVTGIIAWRY